MATLTLEKTETRTAEQLEKTRPAASKKARTTKPKPSKTDAKTSDAKRHWFAGRSGRVKTTLISLLLRAGVLVADYLIIFTLAIAVVPIVAAYLHSSTNAAGLTADGRIAMWAMPLLAVTLLLTAGVYTVMRGMWRWSTRRIEKMRAKSVAPTGDRRKGGK